MFIAMNRFRVIKGHEEAFEQVWLPRDSLLQRVPGFVEFHLLKGPEAEGHTLYSSHTVWESRATFEAWRRSDSFRTAHSKAGDFKPLYLGPPQFEAFEVLQTVKPTEDGGGLIVENAKGRSRVEFRSDMMSSESPNPA